MTTFRDLQSVRGMMDQLQARIDDGILATTTADMGRFSGDAQGLAVNIKNDLRQLVDSGQTGGDLNRTLLRAAHDSIESAVNDAEKVALATDVNEMRARLLAVKTRADWANAYLHIVLGYELE